MRIVSIEDVILHLLKYPKSTKVRAYAAKSGDRMVLSIPMLSTEDRDPDLVLNQKDREMLRGMKIGLEDERG